MSSLYVQKVAEFISRALAKIDISCLIYLDDLFFLLPNNQSANEKFSQAMKMITNLGLPINKSKLIPPTTHAIWLGVHFNVTANTISIPHPKVQQLLEVVSNTLSSSTITYRDAQSLLGRMAHVARVIHPARLFMCRILTQLRETTADSVYVTPAVRADLIWFQTYFTNHNATAIIPQSHITMVIEADACPHGAGAWSTAGEYYTHSFSPKTTKAHNICQLEALNYLIAVRTFTSRLQPGAKIEIVGDNEGAISALTSGRVCDLILAAIARAIWYHAASRDLAIVFTHKPGESIPGADALSRARVSQQHLKKAKKFVETFSLSYIKPSKAASNYQRFF